MKLLLTGAKGQLGTELKKQINSLQSHYEVICTEYDTLDITDLNQVRNKLIMNSPDIIINCAAYNLVDKCEAEAESAYRINAIGVKNLAMICEELDGKLIHISTDYVFDGSASKPRKEDDEVNPLNVYGKSKLLGEQYVKTFCKKHFILRTAWLYGEGNNFVRTMLKLAETKKEIDVVGDQFGTPTSTKDLARTIIDLMHTEYYGTFHATNEGQCSWHDFACAIFDYKGIDFKVNAVTSEEFLRPAKRPKYSVLDNFMLNLYGMNTFRHWREALIDYLQGE